jgi:hypothetical protein
MTARFCATALLLATTLAALPGCASMAVTDQLLVDRTAFALGLDKADFSVSNRSDDGTTTRYAVKTRKGEDFNCFVGGSFNVTGRSVSEAICTKKGETMKNPLLR